MTTMRRILALASDPEDAMNESDWIEDISEEQEVSYRDAVRRVQAMVDDGTLVVIRTEPVP